MVTDLAAIRQALADAMETEGFVVYDSIPEVAALRLPALIISYPDNVVYSQDFNSGCEIDYTIIVVANTKRLNAATKTIDDILSYPNGIVGTLHNLNSQLQATPGEFPWRGLQVSEATTLGTDVIAETNERYLIANLTLTIRT